MRRHVLQFLTGFFTFTGELVRIGNAHAFEIAERVFKLASWLLAVAALSALQQKASSPDLAPFVSLLSSLWLLAMAVSVGGATFTVISTIRTSFDVVENQVLRKTAVAIIGIAAAVAIFATLLPAAQRAFSAVFAAFGLK